MELKGKRVFVAGTGVSGIGAVRLLTMAKASIIVYDGNAGIPKEDILAKLPKGAKADVLLGEIPAHIYQEVELVITSPGIPVDSPLISGFAEAGIPVWGEIELAYHFEKGTVYAITGTNGKTTTTSLVGEIMKQYNPNTFVVGNIGNSYTGEVLNTTKDSITVAEISSFQLETLVSFAPKGTAILNITPDHLDRHYTMENYSQVKESITKNQDDSGYCVLNFDDPELKRFGQTLKNAYFFSRNTELEHGVFLKDGKILISDQKQIQEVAHVSELHIFGNHNYENAMAAVAMTAKAGVPISLIREVLIGFKGVAHRIEFVRECKGIKYYNDSKGTNCDSSIKAIEAMSLPTILIAGGYDKKTDFTEFVGAFGEKVKALVLLGATADAIEKTARLAGFTKIIRVDSLEEAVLESAALATEGDAVLLSPACASWGMFRNFEERGDLFKEYVNKL